MKSLIVFTTLLLLSASFEAKAFECHFFSDRTELKIEGMEDTKLTGECPGGIESHLDKPLFIFFRSPGGLISHIAGFVDGIEQTARLALMKSGVPITITVVEECSSACIPILAGMNRLARAGLLELIVDSETLIGFHGASDNFPDEPRQRYTVEGTKMYLNYLADEGANPQWIMANPQLFSSQTITPVHPNDELLNASGLLDSAKIRNVSLWQTALN